MSDRYQKPKIYFAPLEGITAYPYRNAHREIYRNVDKYYMPFVTAVNSGKMRGREMRDIRPENNNVKITVPQILTKSADDFVEYARRLNDMGYEEINLNAGCPSGTVVAKGKGAGLLADLDALDELLEGIFDGLAGTEIRVSVKTRIGVAYDPEPVLHTDRVSDFMKVYNRYPISELIVHPRYQQQFYRGKTDMEIFARCYREAVMPICYNGDIRTVQDYRNLISGYPDCNAVMIGRGLLSNPELAEWIAGDMEPTGADAGQTPDLRKLYEFHGRIYQNWMESIRNPGNVLFRMKELWEYLAPIFPDGKKLLKKIKKAKNEPEYLQAVEAVFAEYGQE